MKIFSNLLKNKIIDNSINNSFKLMNYVLDKALFNGATDAMVFTCYNLGFLINVRMRKLESIFFNKKIKIKVIIFYGYKKSEVDCTNISFDNIDCLIKKAIDIAKISDEDYCNKLPNKELMKNEYPDLNLYHPWIISLNDMTNKIIDYESQALNLDKRIKNSDGFYLSNNIYYKSFVSTNNRSGIFKSTCHSIGCSFIAEDQKNNNMHRDYDYSIARDYLDLISFKNLTKKAIRNTISRLGSKKIKTQRLPIIFSSRVSKEILLSFIYAISGSNIYSKNSFLIDSIGKQIFPKYFKIYEDPYIMKGLGSAPFDCEGVYTRKNVFVENGILKQYALGSYDARKLGLKTTGNKGGVHNLIVVPNVQKMKNLLSIVNFGILITELMGNGINILTGNYSQGVFGFWVEKGEITFPIDGITIAGNLLDMYKSIIAVCDDINKNSNVQCGSILIEEMMVSGS
ncbi:metallopeptidase TldD-related protein [Candidatus Legionella polyplacis]|uniref:Metallopeptidase TldD-related protein n=1 Tax=Candidatus Legionella polyplacis TaxID=2005262 RepID=A0ABZ2GX97_9GAMM